MGIFSDHPGESGAGGMIIASCNMLVSISVINILNPSEVALGNQRTLCITEVEVVKVVKIGE